MKKGKPKRKQKNEGHGDDSQISNSKKKKMVDGKRWAYLVHSPSWEDEDRHNAYCRDEAVVRYAAVSWRTAETDPTTVLLRAYCVTREPGRPPLSDIFLDGHVQACLPCRADTHLQAIRYCTRDGDSFEVGRRPKELADHSNTTD